MHDFFDSHYGPNNAVLVVAGDIDPPEALEKVRRWFGDIPARPTPARVEVPSPLGRGEQRRTTDDQVQVPRVYLMYHSPSFNDEGFEATDVLTYLLSDGMSSRLQHSLVYERQVAADVQSFTWPTEKVGMTFVVATARPGTSAETLEGEIRGVVEAIGNDAIGTEELEGALNRARRSLVGRLNSVGSLADAFAHSAILRGDPGYVNEVFDRYAAVSRDEVQGLAEELLTPERLTAVHVVPRGAEAPTAAS